MSNTIPSTLKCDWWNGSVIIDEVKVYGDDRGMVSEIFRDDNTAAPTSKMCYISETKPFVMRGPHEHAEQTDTFITWKSRMLYQMYNKEKNEMKWFVTDPTKITRVIVKVGIVHSYRNISLEEVKTLNLPDQLFMGFEKKGWKDGVKIDEIRHEEEIKADKTLWVLGAGGRLGKAITEELFTSMGYHTYHVVPIYDSFKNNKEGMEKLSVVLKHILANKKDGDIIFNCIAKTNVQKQDDEYTFANFLLPKYLTEFALSNKIKFIQFSTDYVYQQGKISEYTKTKKMWEDWFNDLLLGVHVDDPEYIENDYVKVIRLANLFSQSKEDTHNALNKLFAKFKEGAITAQPEMVIMPTDVELIAKWVVGQYIPKIDEYRQFINLSGKPYTFKQLHGFAGLDNELVVTPVEEPETINNPHIFLNNTAYYEIDCDLAIKRKFDTIKST